MKINKLFIAGIATIGILASCVNDQEVTQNTSGKDLVKVSLQLATGTATTRAVGALPTNTDVTGTDAKESKINRVCVGIFKEDGTTVKIYETTSFNTLVDDPTKVGVSFNTTTDAKSVIIAANAPEGWFKNVANKDDFIVQTAGLAYTTSSDGTSCTAQNSTIGQQSTALPMYSGEETLTGTTSMTTNTPITLTRMVARVAITSITTNFDAAGLYYGASFTPTEVFMYKANTSCNWAAWTTSSPSSLQTGESTTPTGTEINKETKPTVAESPTDYSYLSTGAISSFTSGALSSPYYFYVFPNSASTPTKLVIKGTWFYNSKYSVVYYPIIINHAQLGTTFGADNPSIPVGTTDSQVAANTQYSLTATIKGKGVSSPGSDITPAAISLTVSVNPWNTTSQDVTFE